MPKIIEAPVAVNVHVLGLDVHKSVTVYCLLDERGHVVAKGSVDSTRPHIERLLRGMVDPHRAHVTLEACGGMLWLYDILQDRLGPDRVHLAHPRHVQVIARSTRKNDLSDAYWLAWLTREGRLPEAWVPEGRWRDLRLASRERRRASVRRTRAVVELRAQLRQLGERVPTVRLDTDKAQIWLQGVIESAPEEISLALRLGRERIVAAEREIDIWLERLDAIAANLPEVARLEKAIPGAGRVLAATILAETGPVERFHSPGGLARYTGLTPSDRSTGGRVIHGGITREGSGDLRWALTQVVMGCLRATRGRGVIIGDWVRARQRRTGTRAKVRAAAARKLAEAVWRCFHMGEDFDVTRPFGGTEATA